MAIAPESLGIGIRRHFTEPGEDPYGALEWERRDSRITNYRDGSVAFEQLDVEVPVRWSLNATNILAQKYFRGTLGTPERESSLKQVADRVVDTITAWGWKDRYFVDEDERETFRAELKHLIVTQRAAFNSPVWFNIGVKGVPQQASACFILSVDDSMKSILNWYVEEGMIFKGGSGAGVNLSKIRSSVELLNGGGTASGPVSLHAGRRCVGRHHQVGGQDPPGGEDGHPQRRPPRHRGLHLEQGPRGAQGPGPRGGRVRRQPRRAGPAVAPVPERQQLGAGHRTTSCRPSWTTPTGTCAPSPPARSCGRCGPGTSCARSPRRRGSAPTPACSSTPPSTGGTPPPTPAASTGRTRAASTCTSTTRPATWPSINLLSFLDEERDEFDIEGFAAAVDVVLHGAGDPRRQRRLPDREDRRDLPPVPPAGPRLRQPGRPAHGPRPTPTTPTAAGPGPAPSRP